MSLQTKAVTKLEELEARKIELNLSEEEYNSKVSWLKRVAAGESFEPNQSMTEVNNKKETKYPLFIDLPKLLQLANNTYNLEELKAFCFEIGIDFENLSGEAKREKMIELVSTLKRTGQILSLIIAISRKNKHISWEDFL